MTRPPWHRPCPACGADNAQALFLNAMAPLNGLDMSYRVSQCGACSFGYASDLPHPDDYTRYYRTLSKYDLITSASDIPAFESARIHTAVAMCQGHVQKNAKIVDLGCGSGALLAGFRDSGYTDVHGIDPAPNAPAIASQLFGISTVLCGSITDAALCCPLQNAGLICLTGVVEHLPCLHEDLSHILEQASPEAKVLIEVPALERFSHPDMEPFGEFSLEHIQYFGIFSLRRLMARIGYSPVIESIVRIAGLDTDSLFALYERSPPGNTSVRDDETVLTSYLKTSTSLLGHALSRITALALQPFIVYGAGSHTARLLPHLYRLGLDKTIIGVVDGNRNLHGQTIGKHPIHPPGFLDQHMGTPVLVSSHKSQNAIAQRLQDKHPLILMYP